MEKKKKEKVQKLQNNMTPQIQTKVVQRKFITD